MKKLMLAIFISGLVACGSDTSTEEAAFTSEGEEVSDKVGMSLAVEESDLHDCNETVLNQLVYITDKLEFVTCTVDGWETIDIKNPQSVIKTEQIAAGEDNLFCVSGGIEIHSGLDKNFDGALGDNEIKDTQRVCNGTAGQDGQDGTNGENGANGQDGSNGLEIASSMLLDPLATDFCTYYNNESCYFDGGQLIVFTDGSFKVTANWRYGYLTGGDTNINTLTRTLWISAENEAGLLHLDRFIARTGSASYKSVGLEFTRDSATLKYDLDNDGHEFDDMDLAIVTLSDW